MTKKKSSYIVPKIINTLLPIGLAFFIGGIIIACIGENPLEAYQIMLGKSLFTVKGFLKRIYLIWE